MLPPPWGEGGTGEEFLIVDFCWLIDNSKQPDPGAVNVNHQESSIDNDSLGRRLMVGQVPLEHFV
jgi:hypothetical protein